MRDPDPAPDPGAERARGRMLDRMLAPRSIAVVGASARPGTFGERLAAEALRSPAGVDVHLVTPRHREVLGRPTVPTLSDLEDDVDLVLLGVPDPVLAEQLAGARDRGAGGAVVFGSARGRAAEVVEAAGDLALCGAGCMGFVNVTRGIRAIGYVERAELTPGPIALVTHSGSMFSALLRTRRRLEVGLAVSSGQELVTTAADYLEHALDQPETRVVALVLETMRDVAHLRAGLARAAERDVPVVALTVGRSTAGRTLVAAHSGALAGADAAWEALFRAYGVHRVRDLDELVDTLELFAVGRRVRARARGDTPGRRRGLGSVHDSGGERVLVADLAQDIGVPFAELSQATSAELAGWLADGLVPANPLDVWGDGADTEDLFTGCLTALADDEAVDVVALGIDLVEEYDGDDSYPLAVLRARAATDKPVVVLGNLGAAVDPAWATRLRARGVPVLEGTTNGLRALGHLLDATPVTPLPEPRVDVGRRARWLTRLGSLDTPTAFALLEDYGLDVTRPLVAHDERSVLAAAGRVGYPVVLKADGPSHKSDVGGVRLDLAGPDALRAAYAELGARLGPDVVVAAMVDPGLELALGLVRDPHLGPLVVLGVGGTLVELVAERVVALPALDISRAEGLLDASPVLSALLRGTRGRPAVDRPAVVLALLALSQLAVELGDHLEALDVNPLVCGPLGAVAVDVLVVPRGRRG